MPEHVASSTAESVSSSGQASHWAAALALSVSALRYCFSRSHEHWSRGSPDARRPGIQGSRSGPGSGDFFLGYFLLEIPRALIVERWSARRWIARIMISWGMVTVLIAFIHTARQFYLVRFLVGAAEAGFFPGVIVYLTHWFRYEDRAKAVAFFYAANPLSYVIGSPLAGLLLGISWLGLRGWRWLFII